MIRKVIVFFIIFLFLIDSYDKSKIKEDKIVDNYQVINNEKENKKIDIIYNDKLLTLDFEEYIIGVVSCEMPASFEMDALKAMAVAARTFATYKTKTNKNYKMKTNTKDQCYISRSKMKKNWGKNFDKNYSKIKKAVYDTKNEIMTYNDKVIISFYFSISNGYTENCEDVFTQKLSYLKSVDSPWDKEYSYKKKTIKIKEKEFLKKLNIPSEKIDNIKIKRNKTNRISHITINNKKIKGTIFRSNLGLRSTDINIEVKDGIVYITTLGYGHGVGLSQYGAEGMAKEGYNYQDILKHYYTGIKISA